MEIVKKGTQAIRSRQGEVRVYRNLDELSLVAADLFCDLAEAAVRQAGRFTVALSGGSTPKPLYSLLASAPFRERIAWTDVQLYWGDERCVPPNDPKSNYGMAYDLLVSRIPIPSDNVHRMRGEDDPPGAAAAYEQVLREGFHLQPGELPRIDLMLLGLGENAHTASLFPNSPALEETQRLAAAPYVEELHAHRLTLTLPVINNAAVTVFLVSEQKKAAAFRDVLESPQPTDALPATRVQPVDDRLYWFVDQEAASLWLPQAKAS